MVPLTVPLVAVTVSDWLVAEKLAVKVVGTVRENGPQVPVPVQELDPVAVQPVKE